MGCDDYYRTPETDEGRWMRENEFSYNHTVSAAQCMRCGVYLAGSAYRNRCLELHLTWCPMKEK